MTERQEQKTRAAAAAIALTTQLCGLLDRYPAAEWRGIFRCSNPEITPLGATICLRPIAERRLETYVWLQPDCQLWTLQHAVARTPYGPEQANYTELSAALAEAQRFQDLPAGAL